MSENNSQQTPTSVLAKGFAFERFDVNMEDWEYYIQRFEMELSLHDFLSEGTQDLRRDLLLTKVGPGPFKVLVDHFKPTPVNQNPYVVLKEVLNSYYGKQTYIFAERIQFALRFRKDNESITQYITALRGLAGNCEFGDNLQERLRDQLIIGINNSEWQEQLIRSHPTNAATLEQVQSSATVFEQAAIQAKQLATLADITQHTNRLSHRQEFNRQTQSSFKIRKKTSDDAFNKDKTTSVVVLNPDLQCLFCGEAKHKQKQDCPANGKSCFACSGRNHFSKVCVSVGNAKITRNRSLKKKTRQVKSGTNYDIDLSDSDSTSSNFEKTSAVRNLQSNSKVMIPTVINNVRVDMLYDTGAAHSVVGEKVWKQIGKPKLRKTKNLIAYTDLEIPTLGVADVHVNAFNNSVVLPLYVTKSNDIPLFGLDWSLKFDLSLPPGSRLCNVKPDNNAKKPTTNVSYESRKEPSKNTNNLESILYAHDEIFNGELGTIKGYTAKIHIKDDVIPKAFRPRNVPIPLQEQVSAEIDRLVKEDVLEHVDTSSTPVEWASPVVVALKSNGSIRLCGDFRVTINPYVQIDNYPLPRFEEITSKLSGGKFFSTLDLKDAYLQLKVHPESRKYLVIITQRGYFAYKRLPFGVSFAPALFQRTMDQILSGLQGVVCYLDDILVSAPTVEIHNQRVNEVLKRLKSAGLRTQQSKCKWLQSSVTFLGHKIDSEGLHPTEERVEAIKHMPSPTNTTELRSFLGSITYYSRFVKNLQWKCAPLHRFLKKGEKWSWTKSDQNIFDELKNTLASTDTLVHYSHDLPLVIATDASQHGAGAVLFHRYENQELRPISYASRKFNDIELRYSTIDKEALAIVFAMTKFHQYVYGRKFTLLTDHKPLERIFGENRETPKVASNRLLRWAMLLNSYDYTIEYRTGKENVAADALSRLHLNCSSDSFAIEQMGYPQHAQLLTLRMKHLPVSRRTLKDETLKDKTFQKIIGYMNTYWPDKKMLSEDLLTFYEKRDEISFEENVLLWKGRICIPETLRVEILNMLHEGHPGINAMQSAARVHVYWPKIDSDVINFVKSCQSCQESKQSHTSVPMFPWGAPPVPWSRIHIDFAGPYEGKMWLVVIDAYTRWLEILPMKRITSEKTITALTDIFSRYGLPRFLVSDNGGQFTSEEFKDFCNSQNIKHIKVTPYHPKSNGLAERYVRTFKERMDASGKDLNVKSRLAKFLFSYRNTIHKSTERTPSELMFGRRARTIFDQLKPDLLRNFEKSQWNQKLYHDLKARVKEFSEEEEVWVNNPLKKGSLPGKVVKQTGPYSYIVDVQGVLKRKHSEHMRSKVESLPQKIFGENMEHDDVLDMEQESLIGNHPNVTHTSQEDEASVSIPSPQLEVEKTTDQKFFGSPSSSRPVPRRNPQRERRLPLKYRD